MTRHIYSEALMDDGDEYLRIVNGRVMYKMHSWEHPRNIGTMQYTNARAVYYKFFDPNKHTMKQFNAVGINNILFDRLPDSMYIGLRYKDGSTSYLNVGEARKIAIPLPYAFNGNEKQTFIPLKAFHKEKPGEENKETVSQETTGGTGQAVASEDKRESVN